MEKVLTPEKLREAAEEAVTWFAEEWERRTCAIETGESTNIDWVSDDARIGWHEVHSRFPDVRSVDGWTMVQEVLTKQKIVLRKLQG